MKSNIFKYIFIVFLIILGIVTYSFYKKDEKETEQEKNEQQEQEATINIVKELRLSIAEFDTINPVLSNNKNVQEISKIIYEPLISISDDYKVEYCLASEISKTSATSYVVKLREGVKWQDASEFTANDVKFTVDTIKADSVNSIYKESLKYVSEVEIVDNNTVIFNLIQEVPFFEYNLTFPIMSNSYYQGEEFITSDKNKNPVGTGLFKITSSDENVIILEKNNSYWNTERNSVLEKININIYSSMGEVYNAFKNGNIDIINTNITNVNQYIGTIGFSSEQYKGREYDFLALNNTNTSLSSSAVRKAINYSIDKNNLIVSCYGSEYYASEFPIDYVTWLYEGGADNSQNIEEAKNILQNDGWTYKNNSWQKVINKKTISLSFSITVNGDNELNVAVGENIKSQLETIGIAVTLKKVSSENYYNLINSKTGYDAIVVNMNTSFSPNMNTFMGNGNMSNYSNDEVNQILSDINNISDEETLKEKYKRLIELYNQDTPFVSLARKNNVIVYNTNLVGVTKPTAYNIYNHIERWYRKNY